jgi:sulfhydrogenase subunit beta (sulfur reductase)
VTEKKIDKNDIARLLADWKRDFTVFTPKQEPDNSSKMAEWDGKDASFLKWHRNTIVPCKTLLLPPVEEMFRFQKTAGGHYHLELPPSEEQKRLIFGIRPCDARALSLLDKVFEDTYQDTYYLLKRRNTILVGISCVSPYDSCFCTALNSAPSDSANVDLLFTDIGSEFFVEATSEAGSNLIGRSEYLHGANETDKARAREVKESSKEKITKRLDTEHIRSRLSDIFEDEAYWGKIAAKCISCGVCTLLCPTCHCFDISDEVLKEKGHRVRSPDSCSFAEYTRMPMENPRSEKWRRLRNRVCHKYLFYPMNFGAIACTGCGRCIRLCPVKWDLSKMLTELPGKA